MYRTLFAFVVWNFRNELIWKKKKKKKIKKIDIFDNFNIARIDASILSIVIVSYEMSFASRTTCRCFVVVFV